MKKTMLSRNLLLACCLVLILLSTSFNAAGIDQDGVPDSNSSSASQMSIAPLNPAFIQYQEELEQNRNPAYVDTNTVTTSVLLLSDTLDDLSLNILNDVSLLEENEFVHPTGLIPSPVDLSHLSSVNMGELVASDEYSLRSSAVTPNVVVVYPSSYDLRDNNSVTGVRDQASAGSCWAHSTIASLESYLLHSESEDWDFSENNVKNILVTSDTDGFDRPHDDGGFDLFTAAYLTRWSGPVLESDDPYNSYSGTSPANTIVAKHVQEIMILPGFEGNDTLYKWMLTNYGAISVAMWFDDSHFNSDNNSYYYNDEVYYANHAVTLVGWNDDYDARNFTPEAPGNGAFIIKNSWGDDWGEEGYFYASYYDTVMGNNEGIDGMDTKPYAGNFMFTAENVSNYDHIYQYDQLGWTACTGYDNMTAYGANIFTANSNETLEAVSFYTVDSNSFYNISIYVDTDSGPVNISGPVSLQNGSISIAGYHTIDLDTNVSLLEGQNFSVVVQFTTPNYNYPIAIELPISEYSSNAHADTGQSYMSLNGTEWEDISIFDKNICIKAFTKEEILPQAGFVAGARYVHVNESVDFHDTSLFSPTTWEWDFGDNSTSSIQNPLHAYTNTGVYNVSLNVSNLFGSNVSLRSSFVYVLNSTIVVNSSGTADFTTIREAIDAASDGDTIMVEPGVYSENLYFADSNISLSSSSGNPADVSIISPDSGNDAITIMADNISISGINVTGSDTGIFVFYSSGCNITNCYASDNYDGIYLYHSQDSNILNCTISGNEYGLYLLGSNNNYFADNSIENNTFNCRFDSESNVVGTSNTVNGKPVYYLVNSSDMALNSSSNAGLVHLINCSNITVQDLDVENNYYGLYLYNSSNITITNCTSTENRYGAYLSSSGNNTIYGCNISDIVSYGISLTECSDNLIYNNYFNNSNNVRVSGGASNEWNTAMTTGNNIINGTYLGGNFWAKPDGTGWSQTQYSVGNGFCQPYEITDDGNNTDQLPLTSNEEQTEEAVESSILRGNGGVNVRIATSTASPGNVAAMDSSVRYVGREAEVQYVFTDRNTPVTEISFETETNVGYVMATVNLLNHLPENAPSPSSVRVYQSMDIVLGDDAFSSSGIGEATIGFAVSKEWLESNGFDEADIYMEHFSNGLWNRLPTALTGEDEEYVYFEAITTGFSPFMICAEITAEKQNDEGKISDVIADDSSESIGTTEKGQDIVKDENGSYLLIMPALILVGVIGFVFWRKGLKGKV
jgi:PGF-pre-PGF domain-containing protein